MKKFYLSVILILCFSLQCYAVNCEKKPCHKKCIDLQPDNVKLNCYCQKRKNVYYRYGRYGVPEYDERCDGSIESYRIRYCEAKRIYDDMQMNLSGIGNRIYLPKYDANCYSSYEQFMQLRQQLLEKQQAEIMSRTLNQPQFIYHDVNVNGTIKHNVNTPVPNYIPFIY